MDPTSHFAALGDPTRRRILELLRSGPASVGELAERLPVSRPAVSQHLKVLMDTDLVSVVAKGNRRVYSIDPAGIEVVRKWIGDMWDEVLEHFEEAARKERA